MDGLLPGSDGTLYRCNSAERCAGNLCAACGFADPLPAKFCGQCGKTLTKSATFTPAGACEHNTLPVACAGLVPRYPGDRRTSTILCVMVLAGGATTGLPRWHSVAAFLHRMVHPSCLRLQKERRQVDPDSVRLRAGGDGGQERKYTPDGSHRLPLLV